MQAIRLGFPFELDGLCLPTSFSRLYVAGTLLPNRSVDTETRKPRIFMRSGVTYPLVP